MIRIDDEIPREYDSTNFDSSHQTPYSDEIAKSLGARVRECCEPDSWLDSGNYTSSVDLSLLEGARERLRERLSPERQTLMDVGAPNQVDHVGKILNTIRSFFL